MKFLGVIGGLGPMATAYFLELLTAMTDARRDQEHLKLAVYSAPDIPDRTAYIIGRSQESPLPGFIAAGRALKSLGADLLAIPCITAHYFHEEIERGTGIRTLHAIRDSAAMLKAAGLEKVGLMATDGTIRSRVFQEELERQGLSVVLPDEGGQKGVMSLIYDDIKQGKKADLSLFSSIRDDLMERGTQTVLLGCTELSLIKRDYPLGPGILDVMEVLARAAVLECGGRLRPEYENLLKEV